MPNLPPVDPARAAEPIAAATFTPDLLASLLADGDDELAAWTLRSALAEQGLAGVAGEHHGLGLACLDQVLRDDGWSVANLGPDLPPADLARFLARNRADLLALSASLPEREPAILDAVAAARAARADRPLPIMLGGTIVADPALAACVDVDFLAGSLVEAAHFARTVADAVLERDPDETAAELDLSELGSIG